MLELDDVIISRGTVVAGPASAFSWRSARPDTYENHRSFQPDLDQFEKIALHLTDVDNAARKARKANLIDNLRKAEEGDELAKLSLSICAGFGGELDPDQIDDTPRNGPLPVNRWWDIWSVENVSYCAVCGEAMVHAHALQKVCSERCKRARRASQVRQTRPSRAKEQQPTTCATCGDEFTPKRKTARFCSTKCRVAAHRAK